MQPEAAPFIQGVVQNYNTHPTRPPCFTPKRSESTTERALGCENFTIHVIGKRRSYLSV